MMMLDKHYMNCDWDRDNAGKRGEEAKLVMVKQIIVNGHC